MEYLILIFILLDSNNVDENNYQLEDVGILFVDVHHFVYQKQEKTKEGKINYYNDKEGFKFYYHNKRKNEENKNHFTQEIYHKEKEIYYNQNNKNLFLYHNNENETLEIKEKCFR